METSEDFFFDGAADPGWALFNGVPQSSSDAGVAAAALENGFGRLDGASTFPHREIVGRQVATIPDHIPVAAYDCVFLWCYSTQFLLGIGPFVLP